MIGYARGVLPRVAAFAAFALCVHCTSEPCRDEPPSVSIAIGGDLDGAASVEILVEYDDVSRTLPINVEGTSLEPQRIGLIPAPSVGAEVRIVASGYSRVDARGARVSSGTANVDITLDGCNEARVDLEPLGVAPRDGGVAPRDGGEPMVERDAGDADPDAGVPRDAGEDPRDGGEPVTECFEQITRDSVMLYTFEDLPMLDDTTGVSTARWVVDEAGNGPQGHEGPKGCGVALDLDGSGAMQIGTNDGVTPASMDFWIHLHDVPSEAQGIVSRDASGQAEPGHFTLFRNCDDYLVLRVQDLTTSVYLCSEAPLALDDWTHVAFSVSPEAALFVDGVQQTQGPDEVGLFGADCSQVVQCGGTLEMEPPANGLPLVVGASAHQVASGSDVGLSNPFFGAIDNVHARSR